MDVLLRGEAEIAAEELDRHWSNVVEEFERLVPSAVLGQESATRDYVRAWRMLSARFLHMAHDVVPDMVVEAEDGTTVLVDVKRSASPVARPLLDYLAVQAPFSAWVNHFGAGRGVAIFLLSELRSAVPGLVPLQLPAGESGLPHWPLDEDDFMRFVRQVLRELKGEEPLLAHITRVFQLSQTEVASLFGVRRQAVSQWLAGDIPAARQPKALAIAQVADLLERNLITSRIPAIARTQASAYDGGTMLEMIAHDRHDELLADVRESFDWSTPR